jgi:hypothetical protein
MIKRSPGNNLKNAGAVDYFFEILLEFKTKDIK